MSRQPRSCTDHYLAPLPGRSRPAHPEQGLSLPKSASKGRKVRQREAAE
jgi:hypothetical protein